MRAFAESVCVKVRMQVDQELTFERQGFRAEMTLNNPGITDLKDLQIVVNFADANGVPVMGTSDPNNTSAKFFVTLSSSATLPDTVPGGTLGDFKWTIVPAPSAGASDPKGVLYLVGATVGYTLNGVPTRIDVSPDSIRVLPMPQLALDYFLPGVVYGDDPFTPQIEPPIPFTLGVRVKNNGAADAKNLKIESGQPKIIDNRQGLAVKFAILGGEVNGQGASPSLLADFGTVASNRSGVARWSMTASLYGRFTDFSAVFTHSDALGGALTSLIDTARTHTLIHDVLVDLPGRDGVRDFLALDPDAMRVYESDASEATVTDLSANASLSTAGQQGTITVPASNGFSYIKQTDPFNGQKAIASITRGDGKLMNRNNAWFSSVYLPDSREWTYFLNVFDTNNTGGFTYRFVFGNAVNRAPVLTQPPALVAHVGIPINQAIHATDIDGDALTLTAASLPAGASFTDTHLGVGTFQWTPAADQLGPFTIPFTASDGTLTDQKSMTITVVAASPLASWKERYWPGVTDPNIIGHLADPDKDGIRNLVEYALGLDPTQSDLAGLPILGTTVVDSKTYLTLTFVGRIDTNLTLSVVGSTNLDPSQQETLTISLPADQANVPSGFLRTTIRDTVPIEGGVHHRFLRLQVTTSETQ